MAKNRLVHRKALFLHIQKTAGTSIVEAAKSVYGDDLIAHGDFLGRSADELSTVSFVSGHFGFEYVENLLADRFSFTFLRDPVERVVSLYHFCASRNPSEFLIYKIAHELSFEEFVNSDNELVQAHILNHQTFQLFSGRGGKNGLQMLNADPETLLNQALKHAARLDFIGFTEHFTADAAVIYRKLNLSPPKGDQICNRTPHRPAVSELSRETIRAIEARVSLDRRLYDELWRQRAVESD